MAGEIGKTNRVVEKASTNIMKALNRAKGSMGDIRLGETRYDPRTEKKRAQATQIDPLMDTTLNRLLGEMRNPPDNTGGGQQ